MSTSTLGRLPLYLFQLLLGVAFVESLSSRSLECSRYPSSPSSSSSSSSPRQLFPTTTSTSRIKERCQRQRQSSSSICSSRKNYDEIDGDDDDDDYDDSFPNTKFREVSQEEIGLRRMAKSGSSSKGNDFPRNSNDRAIQYDDDDDDDDDYYFEEEEDRRPSSGRRRENRDRSSQRNGRLAMYNDDSYEDDFYDDDDDDDEDNIEDSEAVAGNFWTNPTSRMDRPPAKISRRGRQDQLQRRYYDDDSDDYDTRSKRPPRQQRQQDPQQQRRRRRQQQSSAQSGLGQPSNVLKGLYDQLFWFGFDSDESADVGDKTAFGGTKGKFNGFNYILPEQSQASSGNSNGSRSPRRRSPMDSTRSLPPSKTSNQGAMTRDYDTRRRRDTDMDYNDDDDNSDEDDYYSDDTPNRKRRSMPPSLYKPPTDEASVRNNRMDDNYYNDYDDDYDDYDDYNDEYTENRRTSRNTKSARFDEEEEYMDRRSGGRRRRRQESSSMPEWSPLNMIESFLGIDRDEMNYKADMYDAKMGLGKSRRQNGRRLPLPQQQQQRRSSRDNPGRPGYAYRYDATEDDDDDESIPILDVDLAYDDDNDNNDNDSGAEVSRSNARRRQLKSISNDKEEAKSKRKEQSWEERQIAMERVPPLDIIAWGPSGELSMSAREKAFMDAQEDIATGRRKLNVMKKKESEAKEDIGILKVDAERQRLKLEDAPRDRRSRRDIEELRQIERDIDDASRELRQCRTRVDRALEVLEELEQRHYAIMSCYNVGQASMLVGESLSEFSTSFQGTSSNTSSSTTSGVSASNNADSKEIDSSASETTEN